MSIETIITKAFQDAWQQPKKAAKTADTVPAAAPAPAPAHGEAPVAPPTAETLHAAAEQIESFLKDSGRSLEFAVDDATGRTVISVRDASGELIRQIPSEDVLRLARSLASGSKSLLDLVVV